VNCLEAQALLSASHDHEPVDEADLKAAKAHCKQCAECRSFANGLKYVDTFPVSHAPADMVDRIMAAVAPLAAERAEQRAIEAERAEIEGLGLELPVPLAADVPAEPVAAPVTTMTPALPGDSKPRFAWFAGPVRWASLGAAAALAATALIAFVVIGMNGTAATQTAQTTAASTPGALDFSYGAAGTEAAKAPAGAAVTAAPAQAPDYVVYNGFVYTPGALLADASSATPTIGTLTTSFASGGSPSTVSVMRSPLSDGSIVVQSPDGVRVFAPVIRTLSSARYQLTAKTIDRFGVWPTLPDRFSTPTDATGAPSFVSAGSDGAGIGVFAAIGHPVTEGFAVAPGTSASDPAAGNPNWTWWLPAPTQP